MKKIFALLLSMCLVIALMSGCKTNSIPDDGKNSSNTQSTQQDNKAEQKETSYFNTTGFPIVNEKITLKLLGLRNPLNGPWEEMYLFNELEKRTNIHFEITSYDGTVYREKINLVFAANDLPDVFYCGTLTSQDEMNYGTQGLLMPLEGLVDKYAPNIKKLFSEDPNIKKNLTSIDGHIYSLSKVDTRDIALLGHRTWMNYKWIKDLGLQEPKTLDEFYSVMKAFKEKDPGKNGTIPMSGIFGAKDYKQYDIKQFILSAFGVPCDDEDSFYINDKGEAKYIPATAQFKEYLNYTKRLFAEGILDPEYFTQNVAQYTAKGAEYKYGFFCYADPSIMCKSEMGDNKWTDYLCPMPLTSSMNNEPIWPKRHGDARGTFAITGKCKYPEAAIRLVDYFYDNGEGSIFAIVGFEEGKGGDYKGGYKWLDGNKSQWEYVVPEGYKTSWEYRNKVITPLGGNPMLIPADFMNKEKNPGIAHLKKNTEKMKPYFKDVYPLIYLSNDELNKINLILNDINTYVTQMEAKFITGNEPMDNWDKYIETLNKMKLNELEIVYQNAYNRWNSAK